MTGRGAGALITVGFWAEVMAEGGLGVGKGRRERRQDKSTGTLRLHGVDGVEEFPGPGGSSRALPDKLPNRFNGLLGTFGSGGRNGR